MVIINPIKITNDPKLTTIKTLSSLYTSNMKLVYDIKIKEYVVRRAKE